MSSLQESFVSILSANNVQSPERNRKKLKQLLQREIPGIEFHRPKRVNESDLVSLKNARDAAIQQVEDKFLDTAADIKTLYDAASVLRKAINKAENWRFTGTLADINKNHVPKELYCFYRWVIQGPSTTLSSDKKSSDVDKRVMHLA